MQVKTSHMLQRLLLLVFFSGFWDDSANQSAARPVGLQRRSKIREAEEQRFRGKKYRETSESQLFTTWSHEKHTLKTSIKTRFRCQNMPMNLINGVNMNT